MSQQDLEDYGSVELEYVRFELSRAAHAPHDERPNFAPIARYLLNSHRLRRIAKFPKPSPTELDNIELLFKYAGEALQVIETILYERGKCDWLLMERGG